MTNEKKLRAKELRDSLLAMIQTAKAECREFDECEQKTFDEQKNELLAIAEELKATQEKLDDMEDEIPDIADTDDEPTDKKEAEQPMDEKPVEEKPMDENPMEDSKEETSEEPNDSTDEETINDSDNENQVSEDEINNNEEPTDDMAEKPMDDEKPQDTEKEKVAKRNITKTMNKEFSLLKAIRAVVNREAMPATEAAVIAEGMKSMRAAGINVASSIVLPGETRTVAVNTVDGDPVVNGVHDDVIQTDFQSILEPLYANSVLSQSGVTFLRGLVNDIQIPIMQKQNCGWVGEIDAAAKTTAAFSSKRLSPKRLSCYTDISRQLLNQDSISVSEAIRRDIVNALNDKLEATVLGKVAGDEVKPAGIGFGKSATLVDDYTKMCNFEATLEATNISGEPKYILSPTAKAAFRAMPQSSKATRLVMEGGEIDGTPCLSTTNVAPNEFYYGVWNSVIVGQWAGVEIIVDEVTQAVNGCVRLVINAYFDEIITRPEAVMLGKVK